MPLAGLDQLALFPLQPRHGLPGVTVQALFAIPVADQLCDSGLQGGDRLSGAPLLLGHGVALNMQALQDRARHRLFFAQGRQRLLGCHTGLPGLQGETLGARGLCHAGLQIATRRPACVVRFSPATIEQHALGAAQFGTDRPVALGLSRLPLQRLKLLRQRFDDIVDPAQVLLSAVQL